MFRLSSSLSRWPFNIGLQAMSELCILKTFTALIKLRDSEAWTRAKCTQRSTIGKKFDYLCIQEKTVPPYVRVPLHVSGCKMARLLAWSPRHIPSLFNLVLDIHVMVKWQKRVSADQCHMNVSRPHVYILLRWRIFKVIRWPFFGF